jgi:hypothetical protein
MLKLRAYPRGFLGPDTGPSFAQAAKKMSNLGQLNMYYVGEVNKDQSPIDPNVQVEALYARYVKQAGIYGTFEFRKAVVVTAFQAFGTKSFDAWFEAQYQSPGVTDLHGRFLEDTIRFIETGRREMSLETWGSLLRISAEGCTIGKMSEEVQEFFGINRDGRRRHQDHCNLVSVFQEWLSKPNGMEDLIGTLHLLFGQAGV